MNKKTLFRIIEITSLLFTIILAFEKISRIVDEVDELEKS